MKLIRSFLAANLIFTLVLISFLTLAIPTVTAQNTTIAIQRGYRTGYSDGYMSGYRDAIENAAKSYTRHAEYKTADRAYSSDYGKLSDYKDGYQQGFEKGYDTGFTKRSFDATIPTDLALRGVVDVEAPAETPSKAANKPAVPVENNVATTAAVVPTADPPTTPEIDVPAGTVVSANIPAATGPNSNEPQLIQRSEPVTSLASGDEIIVIPADTELIIELINEIDTERVREGDSFKARVTSPYEISGAIIEGRIAKNRRPGRLKRRAELLLSFDRIKLSETRWSNFNAIIVEVLPVAGDNIKRVDNEGTVAGQRPYKKDGLTIGAATGTGVVIGAVVGGPVGAAVGAGVGAAFGVGAAVVERGKWIKLAEQQQLRIKTAYETQIR
ncbi:MAG: hypothetical protein OEM82_10665 [Acidobacteriota bacterium]|nr:hypothetical protein [Acidobacteriota bacterium]MDH3531117.1 hypothetical protein [Acidobacteriota bacterium]